MSHPLSGLALALEDDLLDLGVLGADEELAAVKADAPEHLDRLDQETGMENRLRQILETKKRLDHLVLGVNDSTNR